MNNAAIDEGVNAIVKIEVPASWKDAKCEGACEAKETQNLSKILLNQ